MIYRKKSELVDAIQYFRDKTIFVTDERLKYNPTVNEYYMITSGGVVYIRPGDYIVKGTNGNSYPCNSDTFEQLYEPLGEEFVPAETKIGCNVVIINACDNYPICSLTGDRCPYLLSDMFRCSDRM